MSIDRAELLDKLQRAPGRMERLIEDHPDDLLCQAGDGGGWGAVEIMAFLRDWDVVIDDRLTLMLSEDQPEFESEDPDLWSIERDYHAEIPGTVKEEFKTGRQALVDRLEKLDDTGWQRTAVTPEGNVITVEDLVQGLVENDKEYLKRIRDLLQ